MHKFEIGDVVTNKLSFHFLRGVITNVDFERNVFHIISFSLINFNNDKVYFGKSSVIPIEYSFEYVDSNLTYNEKFFKDGEFLITKGGRKINCNGLDGKPLSDAIIKVVTGRVKHIGL